MGAPRDTRFGIKVLRTGEWMYESSSDMTPWTTPDKSTATAEWRALPDNKRYEVQPYPGDDKPPDDGVTMEEFDAVP